MWLVSVSLHGTHEVCGTLFDNPKPKPNHRGKIYDTYYTRSRKLHTSRRQSAQPPGPAAVSVSSHFVYILRNDLPG